MLSTRANHAQWADLRQQTAPVQASQMTACAIQTPALKALKKEDSPFEENTIQTRYGAIQIVNPCSRFTTTTCNPANAREDLH